MRGGLLLVEPEHSAMLSTTSEVYVMGHLDFLTQGQQNCAGGWRGCCPAELLRTWPYVPPYSA